MPSNLRQLLALPSPNTSGLREQGRKQHDSRKKREISEVPSPFIEFLKTQVAQASSPSREKSKISAIATFCGVNSKPKSRSACGSHSFVEFVTIDI
jgi:hypothetical protein